VAIYSALMFGLGTVVVLFVLLCLNNSLLYDGIGVDNIL
jgi:hypothetical protein